MLYDLMPSVDGEGDAEEFFRLAALNRLSRACLLFMGLGRGITDLDESPYLADEADQIAQSVQLLSAYDQAPSGDPQQRMLAHPTFTAWMMDRARAAGDGEEITAGIFELGAFAAAAAIRAGASDFASVTVPVHDGGVYLPGVGRAELESDRLRAKIWAQDGIVCISDGKTTLALPAEGVADPRWLPIRFVELACPDGSTLKLEIDDVSPFNEDRYRQPVAGRLSDEQFDAWRRELQEGWGILVDWMPQRAREVARLARYVVPLADMPVGQGRSVTHRFVPGGLALSAPGSGMTAALTLVHEVAGHDKLNCLQELVELRRLPEPEHYLYAPWRDDPRPAGALVHGAFAHFAVADFWRIARQHSSDDAGHLLADAEYLRWREQVKRAGSTLRDVQYFNDRGLALLDRMEAHIADWEATDSDILPEARAYADFVTRDHRQSWRLHNLQPDEAPIASLVADFRQGRLVPRRLTISATTRIDNRDFTQIGRRNREVLLRLSIRDPQQFAALSRDVDTLRAYLPLASLADARLVEGDMAQARQQYKRLIAADPGDMDAWSGLAMTYRADADSQAAAIMQACPEVVAALCQRLGAEVDPEAVIGWLSASFI